MRTYPVQAASKKDIRKSGKIIVLLVEDNEDHIFFSQKAMDKAFRDKYSLYVVKESYSAENFLKKLGKFRDAPTPNVIILDLKLPGKSGLELLEEIKADKKLKMIPIVVLTTSDSEKDITKCYKLGCNSFIKKPINAKEFEEKLGMFFKYWGGVSETPKVK